MTLLLQSPVECAQACTHPMVELHNDKTSQVTVQTTNFSFWELLLTIFKKLSGFQVGYEPLRSLLSLSLQGYANAN